MLKLLPTASSPKQALLVPVFVVDAFLFYLNTIGFLFAFEIEIGNREKSRD
jgi:hypothetical protein